MGCSFEYTLDGFEPWSPTGNPVTLYSLEEGRHTIRVRATDLATELSDAEAAVYNWTFDRSPPAVSMQLSAAGPGLVDKRGQELIEATFRCYEEAAAADDGGGDDDGATAAAADGEDDAAAAGELASGEDGVCAVR